MTKKTKRVSIVTVNMLVHRLSTHVPKVQEAVCDTRVQSLHHFAHFPALLNLLHKLLPLKTVSIWPFFSILVFCDTTLSLQHQKSVVL